MRVLRDLDVEGKRVLVRVDFNVPLEGGQISDDSRIRAALPTIEELRSRGAKIVLASHLGRPDGVDPALSLKPVAERLAQLTEGHVALAPGVVGADVLSAAEDLQPGDILLLENLRFEPGETENDDDLSRELASLADVYVDDAFGAAHRAHASTEGVAHCLKQAGAGLLLERELTQLHAILENPAKPLVAIVGGAKVTDKIGVIERFLEIADVLAIGGAMCFPFFAAQGHEIGNSLCDDEGVEAARNALQRAQDSSCELLLPTDLVIAESFSAEAPARHIEGVDVPPGWMGLDVGPGTAAHYGERIATAGTVFWNGPMGAFELEPFSHGTLAVARSVADAPGTTVVGGGDSLAAIARFGLENQITHLSTGGGAALELLEGRKLPGVEVLS